jgi:hypothetical protein
VVVDNRQYLEEIENYVKKYGLKVEERQYRYK